MNIDLWFWDLDVPESELRRLSGLLSEDEAERAARFVRPVHAARYVAGRGRLREILSRHTGRPATDLAFRYGPEGKPYLSGPGTQPYFNLSHSGSIAMLGVAEVELGVDVELIQPVQERVEDFFSPWEQAALAILPVSQRTDAFYRCWTRKEALLKALGGGLSMGLAEFDVSLDKDGPARLLRMNPRWGAAEAWSLRGVECEPHWMGAIAVRAAQRSIRVVEHALRRC